MLKRYSLIRWSLCW